MMKRKMISAVLAAVMTVGMITGCGSSQTTTENKADKADKLESQTDLSSTDYDFEKEYFKELIDTMPDSIQFFYAEYQGIPVSASIFLYNQHFMHYHLSGTLPEYRNLGAANLVLSEAAYWAAEHNIKKFHLGGGLGIEDSLFSFKKHFNRNGEIDFCIGRNIFDKSTFDELVKIREENDPDFDSSRPFLIKYRG